MTGARPPAGPSRFHSLDALRAVLMMLGVLRHAAMSYVPTAYEGWPYRDAQPDILARWVIVFIRAFQVPVFFAIAGFFAAYLVEARGVRAFLQHRWSRIGVPLVVAWPVIVVTIFFVARFVSPFSAVPSTISYSLAAENMPLAIDFLFVHLWFLYDLMILSVVASALRVLAVRIPEGVRARALDLFTRLAHRGGIVVLALAAGLPLYRMQVVGHRLLRRPVSGTAPRGTVRPVLRIRLDALPAPGNSRRVQTPRVDPSRRRCRVLPGTSLLRRQRLPARAGQDLHGNCGGPSSWCDRIPGACHVVVGLQPVRTVPALRRQPRAHAGATWPTPRSGCTSSTCRSLCRCPSFSQTCDCPGSSSSQLSWPGRWA